MIYITQLIYLKEGQEAIFHQFEVGYCPLYQNTMGNCCCV